MLRSLRSSHGGTRVCIIVSLIADVLDLVGGGRAGSVVEKCGSAGEYYSGEEGVKILTHKRRSFLTTNPKF
ncbi:hypothetical protein OAJ77_00645 [Rhodospirillales bacterium]|nr:hypothetical protein [Rhodospirillales bacterium]